MCGIVGVYSHKDGPPCPLSQVRQMLGMIRHRGPDQFGIYLGHHAALGNARLSIIDLSGGQQPIPNEDQSLWIAYNGEVFNYLELRPPLETRGHQFSTHSDTEVILHLYEDLGPACLNQLNGQFAIAIWNEKKKELFLARDRLGVRPIFYHFHNGRLVFGSEIKALRADPNVPSELDPAGIDDVFTCWGPQQGRSAFNGIRELPPGHYLIARNGQISIHPYWQLQFRHSPRAASLAQRPIQENIEELRSLLIDAVRVRLRADVPVGAYLSGGLDSSAITSIVRHHTPNRLQTFSIAFTDSQFDESAHQRRMAEFLGTEHHAILASHDDIGRIFPDVIWHAEAPLMRTAPAPMFLLSQLVRQHRFKVVLTGEGADEFLAGYDLFKEAQVRRFWARQPNSRWRPLLLKRLYPDIAGMSQNTGAMLSAFFKPGLTDTQNPAYSHLIRWRNTRRCTRFFSSDLADSLQSLGSNPGESLAYPPDFSRWSSLEQAQYLETTTFLSPYLLSSQGDRMAMAHAVEGRYPFLDFRVVDFCSNLPPRQKLRTLTEKFLLRKAAEAWLPPEFFKRPKRPYRAPIRRCFFGPNSPAYVQDLLSESALRRSGLFNPAAVASLVAKAHSAAPFGETDEMAVAGILSSQLLHHHFIQNFQLHRPVSDPDDVKICLRNGVNPD